MKKGLKLISYIITAALFIPNIAFAASDTVVTDSDTNWELIWNWERNQEGFEYLASEINTQNGLKIVVDPEKYADFTNFSYPSKDSGETKSDTTGEYKYYMRFDSDGNPVAYDAGDNTSKRVLVYHQGRNNYFARFNAGETANTGEPIIISYDFDITTQNKSWWNSPRLEFMDFTVRHDVAGKLQIAHNGGNLDIEKDSSKQKHSISVVISPKVSGGRHEMLGIMLDGQVIPMTGIYGTKDGKTDNDCYVPKMDLYMHLGASESLDISNLKITRGFDDIVLSTDFADGAEIGAEGINILSSVQLEKNSLDGNIKVYDCDFDDELIAEPGTVITYSEECANIKFTNLEGGGNYRMEVTGAKDIWGNEYNDVFGVSFSTPEEESGELDDTPDGEAGSEDRSLGDITISSGNTSFHGHGFYEASKTDDVYEVVVNTAEWWNAEESKYGKNNYYYYTDADGNEKLLGYGNDSWNKLNLDILVDETANNGEPLVVSYDWRAENVGAVSEWGSYYMDILGVQCYLSDFTSTETMLKYYENGVSVANKVPLGTATDGWHNIKVVFSPKVYEGRSKVTAVIIDGNITFYDKMYSTTSSYTDETLVLDKLMMNVAKPTEATAANNTTTIKLRNISVSREDGLKAEMFMPLGVQNPVDPIKLNFNYPIPDELKSEDFTIYEIREDGSEKAVLNTLSVSKDYDDMQVLINVGEGGLYYDKTYKLVINKNIVVQDYISITENEYEFSTAKYPDNITAELVRSGNEVNYNISGGGDSFVIMVSTYDNDGALIGLNSVTAVKEGAGNRQKARGSVEIKNGGADKKVLVYIFSADGTMKLYRMPTEV